MDSQSHSSAQAQPGRKDPGPYTVTVYLAAPGTTVRDEKGHGHPSSAGHAYFMISDGEHKSGYGFSPIKTGVKGPGHVVRYEYKSGM
ncbi:hypothetical protein [Xanthomonas hortorum]|uniref:Uncharacterized protein n=1 Tax=Xanthomonas hortorum pv. pelargonii TaxID=453602 RepID=A0A6V7BBH9_9XANT|nr:hypothetical protein [Xanthomonas hortorum]MCE4356589.1 hypothetical protein [Xanthomonas hortorum pv. pelargonii]MCM5526509.1 hypothetical protein [Xanthomonas hortorum pv. pelargonii]MCM5538524.1 hypothetical protein [Xanthomonas hortorum pv. pelargonii]MCM5540655.1 hypothetical protein [Xanthomonas hortorum pv. pelargonii]MCM5546808.1 hypothetical protein [Xanthomonas hortorum pv. pelargonii]